VAAAILLCCRPLLKIIDAIWNPHVLDGSSVPLFTAITLLLAKYRALHFLPILEARIGYI
jgi:hypothetical protein